MKIVKTENGGFKIVDGAKSREFASSDMLRLRAKVAGIQILRSDYSHDTAYRMAMGEMLNETEGSQS